MSKRTFRHALIVVVGSFAVLGLVAAFVAHAAWNYPESRRPGKGVEVEVEIARGMKFPEVAKALRDARVIDHPKWFRLYAMHRGLANKVRAGTYKLRDDMTPREVLDKLVQGVEELDVAVTIPEGLNFREVFALIAKAEIAEADELERLARDPEWLEEQGIDGATVEGYLYPDTYRWRKPSPPKLVLETMVRQHRIVFDDLAKRHGRKLERRKKELEWGDRELVVLASIVEREAADPAERPRIASVFYNRLTFSSFKSRRLETDPTIRYGCTIPEKKSEACRKWDPAGRLHRAQLDDADNPYNTYQHPKLPPGPISNPGRGSLEAVMAPEESEYLYFVAKDARTHVFSRTYEEHRRAVDKYQR